MLSKLQASSPFAHSHLMFLIAVTNYEYQRIRETLPEEVAIAGFYTYGEFSPRSQDTVNHFHQETLVTLLLGEATREAIGEDE